MKLPRTPAEVLALWQRPYSAQVKAAMQRKPQPKKVKVTMSTRTVHLVPLFLLLASASAAGPISPSVPPGTCISIDAMPEFITWRSNTEFKFFAALDDVSNCDPTVAYPTSGVYWATRGDDGSYTVTVGRQWLARECGRIQFDAEDYATGAVYPLVIKLMECAATPPNEPPTLPPVVPPVVPPITPPITPPVTPPVSVPDVSPTYALLLLALGAIVRYRSVQ